MYFRESLAQASQALQSQQLGTVFLAASLPPQGSRPRHPESRHKDKWVYTDEDAVSLPYSYGSSNMLSGAQKRMNSAEPGEFNRVPH